MKIKKMLENKYAVIIEKDEIIINSLTKFAVKEQVGMPHFQMIGAITNITLGYIPKGSTNYVIKNFYSNMNYYQQLVQLFGIIKIFTNQLFTAIPLLVIIIFE